MFCLSCFVTIVVFSRMTVVRDTDLFRVHLTEVFRELSQTDKHLHEKHKNMIYTLLQTHIDPHTNVLR